jgi:hypothetical protein
VNMQSTFVSIRFAGNESANTISYSSNISRILNGLSVADCSAYCLSGECDYYINNFCLLICYIITSPLIVSHL